MCPETLWGIPALPKHQANSCKAQEGARPDILSLRFCGRIERTSSSAFLVGDVLKSLSEGACANRHSIVDKLTPCDVALNRLKAGEATSPTCASPPPLGPVSNGSNVWRRKKRVLPMAVDPRGTARTCPARGEDDRRNREGKAFLIACDHNGDANVIGARKHLDQDPCGTRAWRVPGLEAA